jgi:pilus assembly protein CpaE
MLRAIIVSPDQNLGDGLDDLFYELGQVGVTRKLERYPTGLELTRVMRAQAPHVIFVGIADLAKALALVREVETAHPGVQFVAIHGVCEPAVLLELMRAGVREFLAPPFDRSAVLELVTRLNNLAEKKPLPVESTDKVFAFLPSKAGVGASTLALNTACALSRVPQTEVLLADFDMNCGMQRFMLKLDSAHSIVDAVEHAAELDEHLWPQLVAHVGGLDVLHAGKMNPGFRAEPAQIRHLLEFARRNYRAICIDLSGNMETYSVEIMHECKRIFLVCTPEIPSLHLAREKCQYLQSLDLGDRISILLNRSQKRNMISPAQVESLLGLPLHMAFSNEYKGVHQSLTEGRHVDPASELGKQFTKLAVSLLDSPQPAVEAPSRRLVEYFSLVPARYALLGKKPAG